MPSRECPECYGSGVTLVAASTATVYTSGTPVVGKAWYSACCPACNGTGEVEEPETSCESEGECP